MGNPLEETKKASAAQVQAAKAAIMPDLYSRKMGDIYNSLSADRTTNSIMQEVEHDRQYTGDPLSPVLEQNGSLSKHEDGTYSVITPEGNTVGGLDELTAKVLQRKHQTEEQAIASGAPIDPFQNRAQAYWQSVVNVGTTLGSATTGFKSLEEMVEVNNRIRTGGKPTSADIKKFRKMQEDPAFAEANQDFAQSRVYKNLVADNAEVQENLDLQDSITEFGDDLKSHIPVSRTDQAMAAKANEVVAANDGILAGAWHTVTNDLSTLAKAGFDSTPYMIALTAGGPTTQAAVLTAMAVGTGNEAIAEFTEVNGRAPTREEQERIRTWSAVSTVAEKFGDMAAVKTLPIARGKWASQVAARVKASTPANILNLSVFRPAAALTGEGISGAISSASDQMAQFGEVTDVNRVAYDALAEAAGTFGGVPGMAATNAAVRTAKASVAGAQAGTKAYASKTDAVQETESDAAPTSKAPTGPKTPVQEKELSDTLEALKEPGNPAMAAIKAMGNKKMTPEQRASYEAALKKLNDSLDPEKQSQDTELGSLKAVNALSDADLAELQRREDIPDSGKAILEGMAAVRAAEKQLQARDKTQTKSLLDVNAEVTEGTSDRWTGFRTYLSQIMDASEETSVSESVRQGRIDSALSNMATHLSNMEAKQAAFTEASTSPAPKGKLRVVTGNRVNTAGAAANAEIAELQESLKRTLTPKERRRVQRKHQAENTDRSMNYEVTEMSPAEFKQARKNGEFVWNIAPRLSDRLIENISQETDYGREMYNLAMNFQDSEYQEKAEAARFTKEAVTKTLAELEQEALTEPGADLTDSDIDSIGATNESPGATAPASTQKTQPSSSSERAVEDVSADVPDVSSTNTAAETAPSATAKQTTEDAAAVTESTPSDTTADTTQDTKEDTKEDSSAVVEDSPVNFLEIIKDVIGKTQPRGVKGSPDPVYEKTILELVQYDPENLIGRIPAATFNSPEKLSAYLTDTLGMSAEAAKYLSSMYASYAKFLDAQAKPLDPDAPRRDPLSEPMSVWRDAKTGKFPRNLAFAMAVASAMWLKEHPFNQSRTSASEIELFLYGQRKSSPLTNDEIREVGKVGHAYQPAAQATGARVARLLGLSAANKEVALYMEKLTHAFGMASLQAWAQNPNHKYGLTIASHKWSFDSDQEGRSFKNGEDFLHITIGESLTDKGIKFTDKQNAVFKEISKKFLDGEQLDSMAPFTEPVVEVQKTIPNTYGKVPQKVRDVLKKLQNVAWSPTTAMEPFIELAQKHPNIVRELLGIVPLDKRLMAPAYYESLQASNANKEETVKFLLEGSKEGWFNKVYFKYRLMNQHRIMMQGQFSPQNSHLTRFLLSPSKETTYTSDNIAAFKVAVMFNLGYSVDKERSANIEQEFDTLLDNPAIKEAIRAHTAGETKAFGSALLGVQSIFGAELGVLPAILALSSYAAFADGTTASFKSDIMLEVDGVTNGFAMLLQLLPTFSNPKELEAFLNMTGTYFGSTPEETTHLESGIYAEQSYVDAYTRLSKLLSDPANTDAATFAEYWQSSPDILEAIDSKQYDKASQALLKLYPLLAGHRNLAKSPFMVYQYGAGVSSISRAMADDVIASIYARMTELARSPDKAEVREFMQLLADLKVDLPRAPRDSGMSPEEFLFSRIMKQDLRGIQLNEATLKYEFSVLLAPRLNSALDMMLGETKSTRDNIVEAVEATYFVFREHMKAAFAAAEKKRKGPLTEKAKQDIVRDELLHLLPQYQGPLMDSSSSEFIDLVRTVAGSTNDYSKRVTYSFTPLPGQPGSRNSQPSPREITSAGVSALIRMVINMDSSIMTKTLASSPDVLTLYDAVMGSPEDVYKFADAYNKNYLELGQSVNIAEQVYNQLRGVVESTSPEMLTAANSAFQKEGFSNALRATDDKGTLRSLDDMITVMDSEVDKVEQGRTTLRRLEQEKGGVVSHQMNAPRIKSSSSSPEVEYSAETRELLDTLEDAQKEIVLSSPEVQKWSAAAQKMLRQAFFSQGVAETLSALSSGTEGPFTTVLALARADASNSPAVAELAALIEDKLPGIDTDTISVMNSLLTQEGNELLREELASAVPAAVLSKTLAKVSTELKQYALDISFEPSESIKTAEEARLDNELLSLDSLPYENVEETHSGDITLDSVRKLFNRFSQLSTAYYPSETARKAHKDTLERIVTSLSRGLDTVSRIRLKVENIDGVTQGAFQTTRNRVRVSIARQTPTSSNSQSPQEVYVHELLHAMTEHALKATPLVQYQVRKVYEQTRAYLNANGTYRVFLNGIDNPSAEDIAMAKGQYDYLFNNDANEANVLSEFLAYAVTNPSLIAHLSSTTVSLPERREGVLNSLLHAVNLVVDAFVRWFQGRRGNTAYQDMVAIMEQLVEIQAKHESKYARAFKKVTAAADGVDERIRKITERQVERIISSNSRNRIRRTINAAAGAFVLTLSDNAAAAQVKLAAHKAVGNSLSRVASEVGNGSLTFDLQKQLLISKNKISKQREDTERDFVNWFNQIWKGVDPKEISSETREAMTDVILRTDMSSLLNINMPISRIAQLIGDFNLQELEKKKLLRKMGLNKLHAAIRYADELANHIATGKTTMGNRHSNVYTIAQSYLPQELVKSNPDIIRDLDAYTTLGAMQHSSSRQTTLVRDLIDREMAGSPTGHAFESILQYHNHFVQVSIRDLFRGNPIQSYKGWIVARTDNLHSITTGAAADLDKMKRAGYTEHYPLGKIDGIPTAHDTLYVSRNMPEVPYISGIMSMTGRRAMGTSISDILSNDVAYLRADGSVDRAKIAREIRRIAKRHNAMERNLSTSSNIRLSPTRGERGQIVDYRVMMDHETERKLLEPDLQFQNVFAHMQSSYVDKTNTIINDKQTIDLLVAERVDLYPSIPDRFVDIKDPENPYYDRYRRIPQEVRRYMDQYTVNGKFMVRDDIVDKVFGFTAFDLSQLKYFNKEGRERQKWVARMAHYITKKIVSYGMDRVVIATTQVVAGNLWSNLFQLSMRKISPVYSIKKIWEGFQEYQLYQAEADRLRHLKREIEVRNLDVTNSSEAKEYFRIRTRMENNKIHRMSVAGLNSLIVEDLNEAAVEGYSSRLDNFMESPKVTRFTDRIPPVLGTVAKSVFMTRSSYPYRVSKKVVALSDFLARYVMIEHATTVKGQSFNQAMNEAVEAFVLFDENLSPPVEAFNAVGGTLFVSYWMRNQRAAKRLIKAHPTAVLTSAGIQHLTEIDTLANINSSFYGLDFAPNVLQLDDMIEKIYQPMLINNLIDIFK